MSNYDRPGHEHDRDHDTITRADDEELRRITGIDEAAEKKMEESAVHDGSTANNPEREGLEQLDEDGEEQKGKGKDSSGTEKTEDGERDLFTGKGGMQKASIQSRLINKRNGIILGVVGFVVSLAVGIFTLLPGFIVNQVREILLGKINAMQTSQSRKYRRNKLARVSDMFSLDGRRGGKIIAEMQASGYRFSFSKTDRNRIVGITPPGSNVSIPNLPNNSAMADNISAFMDYRHPFKTSRWKTKRMESFYRRYGVSRISVVTPTPDDLETPDQTINRNVGGSVLDDDYDPRYIGGDEPYPEGATEAERAAIDERNANRRAAVESTGDYTEIKKEIREEGTDMKDMDSPLAAVDDGIPNPVRPNVLEFAGNAHKLLSWNSAKSFFSATDLFDKVCTVKNRLRAAVTASRAYRALSMLKYAGVFVSASDATRTGNSNSALMNSLMKRWTSVDKNGNPVGASPGLAYALKGKFSRSNNNAVRGAYSVDGKLTGTYKAVQDKTDEIPGTTPMNCGVWQNPIFQIGVGIIEVGIAILTGGGSYTVTQGVKLTIQRGVTQTIKASINRTLIKAIMKSVAIGVATELSFEAIMQITQMYAEKSLAFNFSGQERGALLAGPVIGGAGVMHKQRNLAAGMVPATTEQYGQALAIYKAEKAEEYANQSFFARVLDYSNSDSVAFSVAATLPYSADHVGVIASNSLTSLSSAIAKGPSTIISSIGGLFSPKAFAQDDEEIEFDEFVTEGNNSGKHLATDTAGNLQPVMLQEVMDMDPLENIEFLTASGDIGGESTSWEPVSQRFKDHIAYCVDALDILSRIEGGNPNKVEEDCLADGSQKDLTIRFKAHLAWLDALDSLDSTIFAEELGGGTSSGPSGVDAPIDCTSVTGNERIVCAAQNYPGIRYANNNTDHWAEEWGVSSVSNKLNGGADAEAYLSHNGNNLQTLVDTAFIDCSGFTNLAMWVAFQYKTSAGCSGGYVSGADPNIREVPISEARPGDFLTISRNCDGNGGPGHIAILVSRNADGTFTTLESSAGRNVNGEKRSGFYSRQLDTLGGTGEHDFKFAARYAGPGSSP